MSNAQYETYGPSPAHRPPGYGGFDPHSVQTLAYGVAGGPATHPTRTDTYRPAYEGYEGYGGYEGYEGRDPYGAREDTYRPAYEEPETAYEPVVRPRSGRRAARAGWTWKAPAAPRRPFPLRLRRWVRRSPRTAPGARWWSWVTATTRPRCRGRVTAE